jgi:hypothetical protein
MQKADIQIERPALRPEEIAVGVFTSALNLRERALSVQETWLRAFPNGFLLGGYYGDPALKMISLGQDVGEDYHSAHRKQFLGLLELLRRCPEAKWFFITGCDAFVLPQNLIELLGSYDWRTELFVGGHCGRVPVNGEQLVYPEGGPGFALSRPLVEAIAPVIPAFIVEWERDQPSWSSSCDVALAFLIKRERGMMVSYVEGFYSLPPYRYPGNPYRDGEGNVVDRALVAKPFAFHRLSIREMYRLEAGKRLRKPRLFSRAYDKMGNLFSRRLHSHSIVNRISRFLFLREEKA